MFESCYSEKNLKKGFEVLLWLNSEYYYVVTADKREFATNSAQGDVFCALEHLVMSCNQRGLQISGYQPQGDEKAVPILSTLSILNYESSLLAVFIVIAVVLPSKLMHLLLRVRK